MTLTCQTCLAALEFNAEQYESLIRQVVAAGMDPDNFEFVKCPECEGAGQA
jgi:hypothetical protein